MPTAGGVTAARRVRPGPGSRRRRARAARSPRRTPPRRRPAGLAGHSPPATATAICASTTEPPCRASRARSRGPWCRPSTSTSTKPAPVTNPASSPPASSRVWNGLSGESRPGENVSRFGVETRSAPPGRSTRKHSCRNRSCSRRCSTTCSDTTTSQLPSRTGSAARSARPTRTRGYRATTWLAVGASRSRASTVDAEPVSRSAPYPSPQPASSTTAPAHRGASAA